MKITRMTLLALSDAMQRGDLTSREVTQAYLDRIHQVEGKVQAYIAVFPATHCNNQWLTVIGFAHFRCQPQTGDCSMF